MPAFLLWPIAIILALVLFSLAVFIHEFGHFIAARLLGLRADIFSIGFGPALWKWRMWGTEMRFSAIPFGGYVSLPQLDPEGMKNIQGDHAETLPPAPPWKRIIVAVAGPMGNLVLAVVCAALIAWCAPPSATGASTEVAGVYKDSPAAQSGLLQRGDHIRSVNGHPVKSWMDIATECMLAGGSNTVVQLEVQRGNEVITGELPLDTPYRGSDSVWIFKAIPGPLTLAVGQVLDLSPAADAGLKTGDKLLEINGEPLVEVTQLTNREDPQAPLTLTVQRDQEEPTLLELTPRLMERDLPDGTVEQAWLIGLVPGYLSAQHLPWMSESSISGQLKGDFSSIARVFQAFFKPKAEGERMRTAKSLGGPIMIFSLFTQVVQMGLWVSLGFVRLICVNLALLNLLPIPVLDGGHVIFALYALITRRELSPRIINGAVTAFTYLLLAVMVWFLFSDSWRLIGRFF